MARESIWGNGIKLVLDVWLVLDGYPCSVDPVQVKRTEAGGLGERKALEQLAALSLLARWVDACDAAHAADGTAGE